MTFFKRSEMPLVINVSDSPGAYVNMVDGDQVNITKDVYGVALKHLKNLERIASIIKKGIAKKEKNG